MAKNVNPQTAKPGCCTDDAPRPCDLSIIPPLP
jgi:hypothetical protein